MSLADAASRLLRALQLAQASALACLDLLELQRAQRCLSLPSLSFSGSVSGSAASDSSAAEFELELWPSSRPSSTSTSTSSSITTARESIAHRRTIHGYGYDEYDVQLTSHLLPTTPSRLPISRADSFESTSSCDSSSTRSSIESTSTSPGAWGPTAVARAIESPPTRRRRKLHRSTRTTPQESEASEIFWREYWG
ncbi:hypothetical protein F5Y15DRAFT_416130 [Xylariaceae sp. FL0016]|nr:hypothetical protein F5Y15DRAFT_416130 [Xylariaceae sp. FL0016]